MNKDKQIRGLQTGLAILALAIAGIAAKPVGAAEAAAEKSGSPAPVVSSKPETGKPGAKVAPGKKPAAGKKSEKKPAKPSGAPAKPATVKEPGEPVFAIVNGQAITVREFNGLLAETARSRYYHGTIPEALAKTLYKEVGDMLIERELLVREALKRGFKPDPAKFDKIMADLDARYAAEPQWQQQRAQFLPQIRMNAERQSLLEQIEQTVRAVPAPAPAEVRAYYDKHPELFTEPEKVQLSIILLKVDPGSSKAEWEQAREEAKKIYERIRSGADFAEQARLHSQHDSAANGGDLGYLHGGMLPRGMEDKIAQLQAGLNEPIDSLEGIVVPRVDSRIPPKLQEFSAVEKRAESLLVRDQADEAWQKTIRSLHASAKIEIITPQVPAK